MTEQATQTDDGAGVDPAVSYVQPVPVPSSPLAAALARVQALIPRIKKAETGKIEGTTKEGKHYSYEYSYADLAGVSAAILPLLGANGLSFTSWPTMRDGRLVLAYYLLHESGESMSGEYPLRGGTPQATGSEITYARRYALCAVTGVAPDDDDDAAAAQAEQSRFQPAQQAGPAVPPDIAAAREKVKGAWSVSFDIGDGWVGECAEYYRRWTDGRVLADADAAELRRFAAHLSSLPQAVAGDNPADVPAASSEGEKPEAVTGGPKLTAPQRTKINAIMTRLYGKDRQARLGALSALVGRTVESSSDLTQREAHAVIDELEAAEKASPGAGEHAKDGRLPGPDGTAAGGALADTSSRSGEPASGDSTTTTQGEEPT